MTDAYTTRGGLIKPEEGQNLNTWGGKLNSNAFDLADKGMFGFETITVSGDFSLTRANGDATSTQLNKGIRLAGTPTADFTVTFLGYEALPLFVNVSGKNATIKVSAGTGVTLANGEIAWLGYNAALGDVTNVTPNVIAGALRIGGALALAGKITGLTAGTNPTDGVNKVQMETAISTLAGIIAGGLVLNSSSDLAAGYLTNKLTVSGSLVKTTTNAGTVNEATNIAFAADEGLAGIYADTMG